jgi:hypothetical protein
MKITAILNLKTSKHICLKKYINLPTIQVKNLIVILLLKIFGDSSMIVKNIIINACELMNKKDVISYLKGETELNEEIEEVLNDLMVAVNMANNSIASNYIPIKNVVKLKNSQGMILFKNMSDKDILEIYSIKKNNNKVASSAAKK